MQRLKSLPFFAAASKEELQALAEGVRVVDTVPGEALFDDFSQTDGYWFLLQGYWRVTRKVAGQPQMMFEADRPGTWTGGIGVIDAIAPVKVEVLAASTFAWVCPEAMKALLASNPKVAAKLLQAVNWGSGYIGGLIAAAGEDNLE